MVNKSLATVFSTLLLAGMLGVAVGPADAANSKGAEKNEKKRVFKHWLRAQSHDLRRWMHKERYEWWKWVYTQKKEFYENGGELGAYTFPGEGGSDTTSPPDPGPGETPPSGDTTQTERFTVLNGEYAALAVRDNMTGLVWEKSPNTGTINFYGAWMQCARRDLHKQMGWRLPATAELTSLMDGMNSDTQQDLLLPDGHPFVGIFTAPGMGYWSATQSKNPNGVNVTPLAVYFSKSSANGNLANTVGQLAYANSVNAGVWCVKGGLIGPSVTD